jgi:multiple sugar transport system ATP-binding protein
MASVAFDSVTKTFDGAVDAVSDLNLAIDNGELMVLVGPSGCGKSTALRMVAGLETPTCGEILIGGQSVTDLSPRQRDVAMVFQNYALYPHMDVRRNLGFGLKIRGLPKTIVKERVTAAAQMLELTEHLQKRPGQLSGGQRQRVAMGRAIVREPRVFLMDEPLSNLDAKLRSTMRTEIVALQRELRTTMVHVTHDQIEAMTMGHRVAILRHGVLQQVAPPDELFAKPGNVFVASFIGTPSMNLYRGCVITLGDDTRCIEMGAVTMHYTLDDLQNSALERCKDGPIIVGIRPHDVQLRSDSQTGATAQLVESLGTEVLVHAAFEAPVFSVKADPGASEGHDFEAGRLDAQLVARLDISAPRPRVGERLSPYFPAAGLHLFDTQTEDRVP